MTTHTPEPWMLHDMEFATVVTEKKPGRFIALCDGKHFSREESAAHARQIITAHNATYAAGINPEVIQDMWNSLAKLWRLCDDSVDSFETLASEFHTDTGFLRPGKDVPAAMPVDEAEQKKAWQAWIATQWNGARTAARAALAKAKPGWRPKPSPIASNDDSRPCATEPAT